MRQMNMLMYIKGIGLLRIAKLLNLERSDVDIVNSIKAYRYLNFDAISLILYL